MRSPGELFSQHLAPPAEALAVLAEDPLALDEAVAVLRHFGLVRADEQMLTFDRAAGTGRPRRARPCWQGRPVGGGGAAAGRVLPFGGYADPGFWPVCVGFMSIWLLSGSVGERP
jgi:hypothetical protein